VASWKGGVCLILKKYNELVACQKAMDLVQMIYKATSQFPNDELYGLTSQIRRAAISVPSNIAEGQGRKSTREFQHHLSIAYGSLMEVETQVLIAERLNYLTQAQTQRLIDYTSEVGRVINGLLNSLSNRQAIHSNIV
jgi:four helix bundle protein